MGTFRGLWAGDGQSGSNSTYLISREIGKVAPSTNFGGKRVNRGLGCLALEALDRSRLRASSTGAFTVGQTDTLQQILKTGVAAQWVERRFDLKVCHKV